MWSNAIIIILPVCLKMANNDNDEVSFSSFFFFPLQQQAYHNLFRLSKFMFHDAAVK